MKLIRTIFIFCFFGSFYGFAQDNFKFHTVVKGDNIYRISLKYHVTMNAIYEQNPGSESIITIDQILKIPVSTFYTENSQNEGLNEYFVSDGDTKFGLSKKYGITIAQLEIQNPHIINGLQAGHVLRIPKTNNNQNSNSYLVNEGDTKWSLSQRFGMSVAEFEEINPNSVPVLKSGTLINTSLKENSVSVTKESEVIMDNNQMEESFNNQSVSNTNTSNKYVDKDKSVSVFKEPEVIVENNQIEESFNNQPVSNVNTSNEDVEKENSVSDIKESEVIVDNNQNEESFNNQPVSNVNTSNKYVEKENSVSDIKEPQVIIDNNQNEESFNNQPVSNVNTSKEYVDYIIKPKETLFSLSQKAGMSINEFLKLNPQLEESLIVGTIIKMPKVKSTSTPLINDGPKLVSSAPSRTISTLIVWKDDEVKKEDISTNYENYRVGMQMAIDSIKTKIPYSNIEISDNSDTFSLENSNTSNINSNFIITPFSSEANNKRLLDQISISAMENGNTKTFNYKGLVEESDLQKAVIKYLNKNAGNTILIYDKDKGKTKDLVESQISNAKIIPVNKNGIFNNEDLVGHLVSKTKNYVIIESSRDGVFLSATNTLLKQLAIYDIELVVLNPKFIPEDNKVSSKRFRILKLIYPSSFSTEFYKEKKILLKNYSGNISQNDGNDIVFGFGMTYNVLSQIYLTNSDEFVGKPSNILGIKLDYDDINQQFINRTIFIYRLDHNSDTFLLETYR